MSLEKFFLEKQIIDGIPAVVITLLTPNVWVFHTKQFFSSLWTPSGFLQFNSFRHYQQCRHHRLRAQSHKAASHSRCQAQVMGCQGTHTSVWLDYKLVAPMTPSFSCSVFPITTHRTQGNAWLTITSIYYRGYYEGYEWTARWRGTQGKVWKCPGHGNFCPCEVWGVPPSWLIVVFTNLEVL